jgi:DNA-binding SARP family transcriptional activator
VKRGSGKEAGTTTSRQTLWSLRGAIVTASDTSAPVGETSSWQLRLFGGWHLTGPVRSGPLNRRAQRLVAYLALAGRTPRIVAAEALWPETSELHAMSNLRTTTHQVRAACPGLLANVFDTLDLADTTVVDVRRFRTLADPMAAAAMDGDRTELLLNSTDLLPGWYDDWVLFEQERLRQQRLLRLDEEAHRCLAAGEPRLALTLALYATAVDPFRESAQRTLITVHLQMGDRIEALRCYHDFRTRSEREYGIAPSDLLEELVQPLLTARTAGRAHVAQR